MGSMSPTSRAGQARTSVERRQHQRKVRFAMVGVARQGQETPSFRVPLINISMSGVFLRSPVRPPPGEELSLDIQFAAGPRLEARVAVTRDDDDGFGCRFVYLGDSDLSTLQYWMGPYGALSPASATPS